MAAAAQAEWEDDVCLHCGGLPTAACDRALEAAAAAAREIDASGAEPCPVVSLPERRRALYAGAEPADLGLVVADCHGSDDPSALAFLLSSVDPARLDPYARVHFLQACGRLESFAHAMTARAVVAMAGTAPASDELDDASIRAEIAAATRRTSQGAGALVDMSRSLANRLPGTLESLEHGAITRGHASVLVDAVRDVSADAAAWVEQQVLPVARRTTVGKTRHAATKAAFAAEPALAEARARRAREERRVERWRTPGSAEAQLVVTGPPQDIETIWAALDGEARTLPREGDDRPMDARRFDVVLGWGTGRECRTDLAPPVRTVTVNVTVDLATLLGLTDSPGELAGYGPIPAGVARRLAGEDGAWWRRFVHDPVTGYLLDLGTETYRPSAELRRYLVARDRTSRFPGSSVPASRCDLDHAVPAPRGRTSAGNLGALNRTGHLIKTRRWWAILSRPDGSASWRSPSGHTWEARPHDYGPVRTRDRSASAAPSSARSTARRRRQGNRGDLPP